MNVSINDSSVLSFFLFFLENEMKKLKELNDKIKIMFLLKQTKSCELKFDKNSHDTIEFSSMESRPITVTWK